METRNPETLAKTANMMLVIIFLFVALFLTLNRVDRYMKQNAIDMCSKSSRYEAKVEDGKATASYPITDVYKKCLKDKGY